MSEHRPIEREASDQPPPILGPLSRGQRWSLFIPAVLLLLLIGVLLWGTLSSVRRGPGTNVAAGALAATPTSEATTAAPAVPPAEAVAPAIATAAALLAVDSTSTVAAPSPTVPVAVASASTDAVTPTTAASGLPVAGAADGTATAAALPAGTSTADITATAMPVPADTAGGTATALPAPADTAAVIPNLQSPTPNPQPPAAANPQQPLLGRRVGLDPGHGPRGDLGAVLVDPNTGRLVLAEDELNLDVALRTRELLRARGAVVVMTRETKDSFTAPWPPDTNGDGIAGGESDDLQERTDILNAGHVEVFLSIHANSSANPAKRQGIQALYCASADCLFPTQSRHLGALALAELKVKLATAGDPVQQSELRNDTWSDVPGEAAGHLFMLGPVQPPRHVRAAQMPGVVIESLYITSPTEAALLKQDSVRQAIALAYADTLQEYLTGAPTP